MRIGIVCPYDWSVPGGVQAHIRDISLEFIDRGNSVNVLTPASEPDNLPDWVTAGGEPLSVNYNGSVARVAFGFRATAKVRRWIRQNEFDVLHLHEPLTPSLSALACWSATGPIVGTFHSSMDRSRVLAAGYGLAQTVLEKITARIAVSELARNTVVQHVGGDAILIPNGIHVSSFAVTEQQSAERVRGQIAFLGRFEEPRKGFSILLEAFGLIADEFPEARIVVAGPGDSSDVDFPDPKLRQRIDFLGRVSDEAKAEMLRSSEAYVAPNTGGESFGIVLIESMACHTPVIASNLPAFVRVCDNGAAGLLFDTENATQLADLLRKVLSQPEESRLMAERAFSYVQQYDWSRVATAVLDVYETVLAPGGKVTEDLRSVITGRWGGDR